MPRASWRRNHKRPWLPPNNEWGQVRPHRPEGNTLLPFAERCSWVHLNDCHIASFLWGRPQLVTSGWVQRIRMSDRRTLVIRVVFGLGCSGDPHIYSEHRRALQEGFFEWQLLDFITLLFIWSAQTRFTFHALPRARVLDFLLCKQLEFVNLVNKFHLSNILPFTGLTANGSYHQPSPRFFNIHFSITFPSTFMSPKIYLPLPNKSLRCIPQTQ
jgi:hypothetical protein